MIVVPYRILPHPALHLLTRSEETKYPQDIYFT